MQDYTLVQAPVGILSASMEVTTEFQRALSHWLARACLSLRPKTQKFYREACGLIEHYQGATEPEWIAFLADLPPMCPSRWNTIVRISRELFPTFARLKRRRANKRAFHPPAPEVFGAFLSVLDGLKRTPAGIVARFYCLTGLRYEEGLSLRWEDVRPGFVWIRAEVAKNGVARAVPLLPGLRDVLNQLREVKPAARSRRHDAALVLPRCDIKKALAAAARAVGLKRWSYHDCRHYFATRAIMSGVDMPTVARWLGHQDGGALLAETYFHLADAHSMAMAAKCELIQPGTSQIPAPQLALAAVPVELLASIAVVGPDYGMSCTR